MEVDMWMSDTEAKMYSCTFTGDEIRPMRRNAFFQEQEQCESSLDQTNLLYARRRKEIKSV